MTGQPNNQQSSRPANRPPDMEARESSEAPDACQPDTGPGGPTPDAEHAAAPPQPTAHGAETAGHAGAAPSTAPAHRSYAGVPGDATSREAPRQGPPQAHAESEARANTPDTPKRAANRGPSPGVHTRDEDSFDAYMESCRSAPHTDPTLAALQSHQELRGDNTGGTPLTVSHQVHLQRDYAAGGARTDDTPATDDGHATKREATGQTLDEPPWHSAQGSGMCVETGTNTANKPADQPPGTTPSWGRGHLDYTRSEGDARRPSAHAEEAAAKDLDLWIDRITAGERLAQAVSIRWLLTSQSCYLQEGTGTMADVAFGHRGEPHASPTTMDHPSQWYYLATRLMGHMGTYSPDEMNRLHWRWLQRAALRIRRAMQRHNIWAIPGSLGYQGYASGHRRPRSEEVPEPPNQTARNNSKGRHGGPPPGMGSPSSTYRSPLQPFAPQRDRGSPHTPRMQSGAPERHATPRSTASRLPRGYGQRPWRPQRPSGPTDIICHRSPAPLQEAPHQAGTHPHHSHAGRASAKGGAPHRPPPGNRRCVQLVRRLPPRVGGRSATGGTERHGHTAKGTRHRPATRTGAGGTNPSKPPPASSA